jgi:hypothetical protein
MAEAGDQEALQLSGRNFMVALLKKQDHETYTKFLEAFDNARTT